MSVERGKSCDLVLSLSAGNLAVSSTGLGVEYQCAISTTPEEGPASANSAITDTLLPDSVVISAGRTPESRHGPAIKDRDSLDDSAASPEQASVSACMDGSDRTNVWPKQACAPGGAAKSGSNIAGREQASVSGGAAKSGSNVAVPEQASVSGGAAKSGSNVAVPEQASVSGGAAKSGSTSTAPEQASAFGGATRSASGSVQLLGKGASGGSAKSGEPATSSSRIPTSAAASAQQESAAAASGAAGSNVGGSGGGGGARLEEGTLVSGTAPPNSSFTQYLLAELNPNTVAPPSVMRQANRNGRECESDLRACAFALVSLDTVTTMSRRRCLSMCLLCLHGSVCQAWVALELGTDARKAHLIGVYPQFCHEDACSDEPLD